MLDEVEGRRIGGHILLGVARLLGARVTSFERTKAENDACGGSPTSAHLVGGAVDVGLETGAAVRSVLSFLSCAATDGLHQGTAPHFHYTGGWSTVAKVACGVAGVGMIVRRA